MNTFLFGATAMAAAIIALILLRQWRLGGERLLGYFAAGFAVYSLNSVAIAAITPTDETRYFLYLPRLLAFGLILAGVVDKNRRHRAVRRWRTDIRPR